MTEEKDTKIICEQVSPAPDIKEMHSEKHNIEHKKSGRPGLYIKVMNEDDARYQKALQYIAVFDGITPLYVFFTDTKKLMLAPAHFRVSLNDVLLRELKKLLGDDNVAVNE